MLYYIELLNIFAMENKKQLLKSAFAAKIENWNPRTSSAKEYFYVSVEGEGSYLFTAKDLEKAKERADKNPEDIAEDNFVKPVVVPPAKGGIFSRLVGSIFGTHR